MKIKLDYFSLSPLILFFWGLFSVGLLPIIPIASGFGWDGIFYAKVALHFQEMIGHIDNYHSTRIFPGVLIYYVLALFKIPITLKMALIVYQIYYLTILILSGVCWVKISRILKLSSTNEWIGFISIFVSYPVLNYYFYYPALTDGTTLFVAILLIHCHLKTNYLLLFIVTVISFFSWPTGILMCFSIFVYAQKKNVFWEKEAPKLKRFLLIFLLLLPLIVLTLGLSNLNSITSFLIQKELHGSVIDKLESYNNGISYRYGVLFNSLILVAYYLFVYWMILKNFEFLKFIKSNFKKDIFIKILICLATLFILGFVKKQIYSPQLPTVNALGGYALPVLSSSTNFTLQFIVCHISFWGPSIILIILFFRKIIYFLKKSNLDIMLGLLITLIFSINAESRAITNFYPFLIFVLIQVVDFSKLKHPKCFVGIFLVMSLIYSKVWLQIQLPSSVYPNSIVSDLDKFPMQWYFMNFGLWINFEMYVLHGLCALLFGFILFIIVRNLRTAQPEII